MKLINKNIRKILSGVAVLGMASTVFSVVLAPTPAMAAKCAGVETAFIDCGGGGGGMEGIASLLVWFIRILTVLIGIVAVGSIVYASITYASAHDNEAQVAQAKEIIRNVVIGLVLYALMTAGLNFLIPGGIFS